MVDHNLAVLIWLKQKVITSLPSTGSRQTSYNIPYTLQQEGLNLII